MAGAAVKVILKDKEESKEKSEIIPHPQMIGGAAMAFSVENG